MFGAIKFFHDHLMLLHEGTRALPDALAPTTPPHTAPPSSPHNPPSAIAIRAKSDVVNHEQTIASHVVDFTIRTRGPPQLDYTKKQENRQKDDAAKPSEPVTPAAPVSLQTKKIDSTEGSLAEQSEGVPASEEKEEPKVRHKKRNRVKDDEEAAVDGDVAPKKDTPPQMRLAQKVQREAEEIEEDTCIQSLDSRRGFSISYCCCR